MKQILLLGLLLSALAAPGVPSFSEKAWSESAPVYDAIRNHTQ